MRHIVFVEASQTGAGLKAIEYARSKGYFVTLLTRKSKSYSEDLVKKVNQIWLCDTNSTNDILVQINLCNQAKKIDGVTTTADFYVSQASLAANILNLPSMSYASALRARNKYVMRSSLEKVFPEMNPPFALAHHYEDALQFIKKHGFPIIAKPQDQNDSINVKKINNEKELYSYMVEAQRWQKNSDKQTLARGVLLEGYIDGQEYSVETIQSQGGTIYLMGITRKDSFLGSREGNFTELGLSFPVCNDATKKIFHDISRALRLLTINCGAIHTECRVDKNGVVKILEINPRLAGDMLGSHAMELASGESTVEKLVEIALGNQVVWQPKKHRGAAIVGISSTQTGIFDGIENLGEILKMPGVEYINIWTKPGTLVRPALQSNAQLIGRIVTLGKDADEAIDFGAKAAGACKIKISKHNGKKYQKEKLTSKQFGIFENSKANESTV